MMKCFSTSFWDNIQKAMSSPVQIKLILLLIIITQTGLFIVLHFEVILYILSKNKHMQDLSDTLGVSLQTELTDRAKAAEQLHFLPD